MDWIQAITIGFLGSFHCMGMCGPLALALPLKEHTPLTRISSALIYNTGRISTYFVLGFVFGWLGQGLELWGFQRWASIVFGIVMILSVLFPVLFRSMRIDERIGSFLGGFKSVFARFFGKRTYGSVLMIGLLNGFLPCGLVYIALAGAIVSGTPLTGGLFMLLFGLGTVPALFAVTMAGSVFGLNFRNFVRRIIPFVIVLIGLLFILRGLNLGIPYLSPEMQPQDTTPACCHGH